jgi:hypothetical protein
MKHIEPQNYIASITNTRFAKIMDGLCKLALPAISCAGAFGCGSSSWDEYPTDTIAQAWASGGSDVLVNNPTADMAGFGHTTQSETSVVAVGTTVCVAWNDTGDFNSGTGFGFSDDGGKTFTDGGGFPPGPGDGVHRDLSEADPSLAYSVRDSAFYYASLSFWWGMALWRSNNGCRTFQYVAPLRSDFPDKELIAIDNTPTSPFFGRIHIGWLNDSLTNDKMVAAFSDDGGASWSSFAPMPGSGTLAQGMYPAIAPNGHVYMAVVNQAANVGGLQDQFIFKSTNGGVSWTKMANIASGQLRSENAASSAACGRQALNGNIRNMSLPQIKITVDTAAPAGYAIHAIYAYDSDGAGPDNSNVFHRRSVDGAASWSAEAKLNDDTTTTDQFFPALGVSATGMLVASWYDRRLDPNNLAFDRYATFSTNRGLSWRPNRRISDVSSPVAQTNPNFDSEVGRCYHGDYDEIAVTGTLAHVVWSDDRNLTETGPNPDVFHDKFVLDPNSVDVDADGIADLVLTGAAWNTIPVAFGLSGGGYFETNRAMSAGSANIPGFATQSGAKPVAGDFNGDGRSDFALIGGVGWASIPVAFSNGNGSFLGTNGPMTPGTDNTPGHAAASGAKPVSGDFNRDGRTDIALVGGTGWASIPVAFSNGDGTFRGTNGGLSGSPGFPGHATVSGAKPVSGDFNGDGFGDIALIGGAGWASIPVAFSNGDGTFRATNLGMLSGTANIPGHATASGAKPVSGDFNGDGRSDIALTGGIGWASIPVAFSNGNGEFRGTNLGMTPGTENIPGHATASGAKPVPGDFNGDGLADIALTGGTGWASMPVAYSKGDGTFRGANDGVAPFGGNFPGYATHSGAKPVTLTGQ